MQKLDEQITASIRPAERKFAQTGSKRLGWFLIPVVVLMVASVFTVRSRAAAQAKVVGDTNTLAVQHVSVVHPARGTFCAASP